MAAAARAYHARDHAEAERRCLALIEQEPRHFDALHLLGVVCLDRAHLADAVGYLTRAARERPDDAQVNYHLGTALLGLKLYEQAAAALRRAVALRPGDAGTLNNLGNALAGSGRHDEAIACYRQVLAIDAGHVPARFNLGRSLAALDRLDEAVASFRAALAHAPRTSMRTGWPICTRISARRWSVSGAMTRRSPHAVPSPRSDRTWRSGMKAWSCCCSAAMPRAGGNTKAAGASPTMVRRARMRACRTLAEVAGRRVLLTPEQGHGDMIQFARYVPLLAAQGAQVIVQTFVELKALMRTLDGVERVVAVGEREPPADIVTPLFSLPLVFGTRLDTIPAQVPVSARAAGTARGLAAAPWSAHASARRACLAGFAAYSQALAAGRDAAARAVVSGIELHALQKEIPPAQRDWLAAHHAADRPQRGAARFRRHRGADLAARSGGYDRYVGCASCRRAGRSGMDHAAAQRRLALAARSQRQSVVSDRAAVPSAEARRLGWRGGRRGAGAGFRLAGRLLISPGRRYAPNSVQV